MSDTKFEMHYIVELFGHQQIAGKVTEQSIGVNAELEPVEPPA
jgi:hypothetical protein